MKEPVTLDAIKNLIFACNKVLEDTQPAWERVLANTASEDVTALTQRLEALYLLSFLDQPNWKK